MIEMTMNQRMKRAQGIFRMIEQGRAGCGHCCGPIPAHDPTELVGLMNEHGVVFCGDSCLQAREDEMARFGSSAS